MYNHWEDEGAWTIEVKKEPPIKRKLENFFEES